MTETDIECGHTETTVHGRGLNKSRKIIAFSHLKSNNSTITSMITYVGKI